MQINQELLDRCRKQDRRAQNELYKACYGPLMAVCLRYEKNKEEAGILLNESFFKILTKLDLYQRDVPFEAWAKRITINTIIDELRRRRRDRLELVESMEFNLPLNTMDYNEADQKFDAEELVEMIRKLPPVTQKVFNLYVVDGYSHKEISDMLSMSEGTSKWHLSHARKTIKEMLVKVMNKVATLIL